jgi:hypothetical protein
MPGLPSPPAVRVEQARSEEGCKWRWSDEYSLLPPDESARGRPRRRPRPCPTSASTHHHLSIRPTPAAVAMTLKPVLPPTPDQPSVSQFFKRKTPPPRSATTSPPHASASSSTSVKRVKTEHNPPTGSARSSPAKGKGRAEVIVLDSDDESDAAVRPMAVDGSDDEVQMISAPVTTVATAGARSNHPRMTAAGPPSVPRGMQQQPTASGSRSAASSAASTSSSARPAAPVAAIFQRAQQAAHARPSAASAATKRPAFNAKDSAAAQALRALTYVEPDPDPDDQLETSGVGPSIVTQVPLSAEATAAKAKRHEQFATKLLGRRFGRRRSLDLDEAEARAGGGSDYESAAGESNDGDEIGRIDDDGDGSASPERGNAKLDALKSKLTAPVRKTAGDGKKKAPPEVGPSGLTYTPLEEQVRVVLTSAPVAPIGQPTDRCALAAGQSTQAGQSWRAPHLRR